MHWDFPCLVATKRLPLSGKTECTNITLKRWSRRSMNYWGKESRENLRTSWCVGRAVGVTIGRTCGTTSGIATLPKTLFPRPPTQYLWCALLLPSVITSKWTYLITLSMTMLAGCAKPTLQFCSLVRACTLWSSRSQTRNRQLRAQWKQTWGCRRYKKWKDLKSAALNSVQGQMKTEDGPGAKTIKKFGAWIGAQLEISCSKFRKLRGRDYKEIAVRFLCSVRVSYSDNWKQISDSLNRRL